MDKKFDIFETNTKCKKIALDLYERCKSEKLTVYEFNIVIEKLKLEMEFDTKI